MRKFAESGLTDARGSNVHVVVYERGLVVVSDECGHVRYNSLAEAVDAEPDPVIREWMGVVSRTLELSRLNCPLDWSAAHVVLAEATAQIAQMQDALRTVQDCNRVHLDVSARARVLDNGLERAIHDLQLLSYGLGSAARLAAKATTHRLGCSSVCLSD